MRPGRLLILIIFILSPISGYSESSSHPTETFTVDKFITLAAKNDTVFSEILIDELVLKYREDLIMQPNDIILSVLGEHQIRLDDDETGKEMSASLEKLFRLTGTEISAGYSASSDYTNDKDSSITALISQPIAKNAFGTIDRLTVRGIEIENDITKHQIAEAYEDYLSALIKLYFNWYSTYERLQTGKKSYSENLKLLDNVKERKRSRIALDIDVNKVRLQVLAKKENLVALENDYSSFYILIKTAIRHQGPEEFKPAIPENYAYRKVSFDSEYPIFESDSRTYRVLDLLEDKAGIDLRKYTNNLLPSTDLYVSFSADGSDYSLKDKSEEVYAGISLEFPITLSRERAQYQTSKILDDKTRLSSANTRVKLKAELTNLAEQIASEQKLIGLAQEKIEIANSILDDEIENYSLGQVTLNDLIQVVNQLENNEFNETLHTARRGVLVVEWLRLTDKLISKKDIPKQ